MHAITFDNIEVMNLKESKEGCMRVFGRRKGKNKMQLNYNFKKTLLIQACNFSRVWQTTIHCILLKTISFIGLLLIINCLLQSVSEHKGKCICYGILYHSIATFFHNNKQFDQILLLLN